MVFVEGPVKVDRENASRFALVQANVAGRDLVGYVDEAQSRVAAEVPLPLGGLMSDRPIEEVRARLDTAIAATRELGSTLHDPFMAMSFLSLEVIPALKVTDKGLVDVASMSLIPLWVDP